jgi:hypothetical protein
VGCFIGGEKHQLAGAGPIPVAAFCAARGLGTFSKACGLESRESKVDHSVAIRISAAFLVQGGMGFPFELKSRSWRRAVAL